MDEEISLKSYFVPLTVLKASVFIFLIGIVVFGNTVMNHFLWDDLGYIIQNPLVHTIDIGALFGKNIYNTAAQYRPLPALYFSIIYALFSNNQFFYHFLQIVLHCVNAILVLTLLRKFIDIKIAFIASLLFLVHPLQVESVSFIGATGNPLFFLFGIHALLLSTVKEISWKRLVGISCLVFLSLLAKETGILFVIVILSYSLFYRRKNLLPLAGSFVVTGVVYYLLRYSQVGGSYHQPSLSPIASLSLFGRLLNAPAVLGTYLRNLVFPDHLAVEHLWTIKTLTVSNFFIPLVVEIGILIGLLLLGFYLYAKKKKLFPSYIFFFIWLLVGMGMYSQIVPLDYTVADRWMYFPLAGIVGLLGVGVSTIKINKKYFSYLGVASFIVIAALSIRTMYRNTDWHDAMTLFTTDSKINNNYDIQNNIGSEYFNKGEYQQALKHFKASEKMLPYEVNTYNIGITYHVLQNVENAKEAYLKVINQKHFLIDRQYRYVSYIKLAEVLSYSSKPTPESLEIIKKGTVDYSNAGLLWAALSYNYRVLGIENEESKKAVENAYKYLPQDKVPAFEKLMKQ